MDWATGTLVLTLPNLALSNICYGIYRQNRTEMVISELGNYTAGLKIERQGRYYGLNWLRFKSFNLAI